VTTITLQVKDNRQKFIQGVEKFVSNFNDVSFSVKEEKSFPRTLSNISNFNIENILIKEAKKKNLNIIEYLNYLIAYELEKKRVKEDMKTIDNEIRKVRNGTLKLQTLNSLIDELDD